MSRKPPLTLTTASGTAHAAADPHWTKLPEAVAYKSATQQCRSHIQKVGYPKKNFENTGLKLVAVTQRVPDDNENQDGAKAAATKFFCAVTRYQCPKEVVHVEV